MRPDALRFRKGFFPSYNSSARRKTRLWTKLSDNFTEHLRFRSFWWGRAKLDREYREKNLLARARNNCILNPPMESSFPRSRFLDVTQRSPKGTFGGVLLEERGVSSKKRLRGKLIGIKPGHKGGRLLSSLQNACFLLLQWNCGHPSLHYW